MVEAPATSSTTNARARKGSTTRKPTTLGLNLPSSHSAPLPLAMHSESESGPIKAARSGRSVSATEKRATIALVAPVKAKKGAKGKNLGNLYEADETTMAETEEGEEDEEEVRSAMQRAVCRN